MRAAEEAGGEHGSGLEEDRHDPADARETGDGAKNCGDNLTVGKAHKPHREVMQMCGGAYQCSQQPDICGTSIVSSALSSREWFSLFVMS